MNTFLSNAPRFERILWGLIGICFLIHVGFAVNLCGLLSNVFACAMVPVVSIFFETQACQNYKLLSRDIYAI
jgi:hypothetical protein